MLDAIFGDPAWLPHPVVYMGKAISRLEKFLRARLPKTPQGELLGGAVVAFCLPVGTLLFTGLVCWGAARKLISKHLLRLRFSHSTLLSGCPTCRRNPRCPISVFR